MCDPRLRKLPLSVLLRNIDGPAHTREPIEQIDDDWVYATPAEVRAELDRRFPVQPAAPVSVWQPIRTSPINERVIVSNGREATVAIYKAGSWWLCAGDMLVGAGCVWTHWMPLPEVPK